MDVTLSRTAPLYAGTSLTLTCTVTLDPNVDNGESVMTEWSGPRDISGERYAVTAASGSGSTYTGSLTISPLADQDDGTYICTGTVTGGTNVQQATAVTITVMGERVLRIRTLMCLVISLCLPSALPDPEVTTVADSTVTAGGIHTVQCTVTDTPFLAVQPTVELTGPGDSALAATDTSFMVTHTLDPVMTSHAGQYTCRASVMIASVGVDVSAQSSYTLTVQSKLVHVSKLEITESSSKRLYFDSFKCLLLHD